jgi:lipoprotein-anchoring transpeptidase ErfK/SrfK
MRLPRLCLILVVILATSAVCTSPAPAATPGVKLSDERTETYWANVKKAVAVRKRPAAKAPKVGELTRLTYYRFRDVVLVLRETQGPRPWSLVRYPGLGNRTGWVPSAALGERRLTDTAIVIDRKATKLTVLREGRRAFTTRIGVGAAGSPTPAGRTYLRERLLPRNPNGIYGVLAFGLSTYSPHRTDWAGGGQVGIHGTNQPGLIPGFISNGCVRLRNKAIRRVDRLTGVGTPVTIE